MQTDSNRESRNVQCVSENQKIVDLIYQRLYPNKLIPDYDDMTPEEQEIIKDVPEKYRIGDELVLRRSEREKMAPRLSGDDGYVYFVQSQHDPRFVKIGWSNHPSDRISKLQIGCPVNLRMIYLFRGSVSKKTEANFHDYYSKNRFRNEWFKFTSEELDRLEIGFAGKIKHCEPRYDRKINFAFSNY